MGIVTAGYHRIGSVMARASFGLEMQSVPGASIYVTLTSTGTQATIYSDPGLSSPIAGALITADVTGAYDYYLQLNYSVTETISAPNGSLVTITNIVQNTALGNFLTGEIVEGSGTAFVLAQTPVLGSVALYNGSARIRLGTDYTISGDAITMLYSVSAGAIYADYRY